MSCSLYKIFVSGPLDTNLLSKQCIYFLSVKQIFGLQKQCIFLLYLTYNNYEQLNNHLAWCSNMFYNEIPNSLPFSLDIAVKIVIRGRPTNCCGSKERLKIQVALIQARLAQHSQRWGDIKKAEWLWPSLDHINLLEMKSSKNKQII